MHSFGESHGPALGVVIDGCPAGIDFDHQLLETNLERRRPGQSFIVSGRNETDQYEILSGVFEGKTLGTPLTMIVRNQDARSQDYEGIKTEFRKGHADDLWKEKFGVVDHRGGGRASGRETLSRVLAGSVAEMFLKKVCPELQLCAWTNSIGQIVSTAEAIHSADLKKLKLSAEDSLVRCPDQQTSEKMISLLENAKVEGQSYGGRAIVEIEGLPKALGQPVFHKLKSDFAAAFMSLGATSGFEIGEGQSAAGQAGVEFHQGSPYGGIRGGLSTGERISMKVSFKPTSSVLDVAKKGRHDPCIVPRAIPVLEAMTYLVLADHVLWSRLDRA